MSEEADKALQEFAEKEPDEPPLQAHEAARLCRWFLAGYTAGRASRTLAWSTESPTKPGRYFRRLKHRLETGVVLVTQLDINIRDDNPPYCVEIEWAGPIPEPEEPR